MNPCKLGQNSIRTFRDALPTEDVETLRSGEVDIGKTILRDHIIATVGFGKLAEATGTAAKSPMWMLGPSGNPAAENLLAIIGLLQRASGACL